MTISTLLFKNSSIALGAMAIPSWAYSADLTSNPLPDFDKNTLADAALSLAKNSAHLIPIYALTNTESNLLTPAKNKCNPLQKGRITDSVYAF